MSPSSTTHKSIDSIKSQNSVYLNKKGGSEEDQKQNFHKGSFNIVNTNNSNPV